MRRKFEIKRKNLGEYIFDIFKIVFLSVFVFLCVYPFYYVIIYSLSDPQIADGRVWFWPVGFTFDTYKQMLAKGNIPQAVFISVSRTVIGTFVSTVCTAFLAYLMTLSDMPCRKLIYRYFIITMYLSAGLISVFLVYKAYGFMNTFWVYIIPGAVGVYNMILIKTSMEQIPSSLQEAAYVEGAGYFAVFRKIVFPLSKPIIATIVVYNAVGQWNAWQDNFFYNQDEKLRTLQMLLQKILLDARSLERMMKNGGVQNLTERMAQMTPKSVQMAVLVITLIPILMVYPFAQKYFTKGIMIGAVKG